MAAAPLYLTSIHWIIRFGAILQSYHKLQPKSKTVPEFKDAIQLIRSDLPEKATDNVVKDYRNIILRMMANSAQSSIRAESQYSDLILTSISDLN